MKDVTKIKSNSKWNKKIQLKLSLKELQIIYDCVGAMTPNELREKAIDKAYCWNDLNDIEVVLHNVYESLDNIISNHGGIVD